MVHLSAFPLSPSFICPSVYQNNVRPGEKAAPSCVQARRCPIGFGVAPSGNAPRIAPYVACARYKGLHPSLFLSRPSISPPHLLPLSRSFSLARVCAPLPAASFYRPSPIACLLPSREAFCHGLSAGIASLNLSRTLTSTPSPIPTYFVRPPPAPFDGLVTAIDAPSHIHSPRASSSALQLSSNANGACTEHIEAS